MDSAEQPDDDKPPQNDEEFRLLMLAAQAGDQQAIARLCRYYEPIVRVTARRRLGPALRPHFDSIDLVQSVHRSLLIGLRDGKFDISSPEKLVALANAMVHRKIGRKWRRTARQQRLSGGEGQAANLEQQLELLVARDVPNSFDARDLIARLCQLLSFEERRMLELRLEGYNSTETAERLELHPVAVRVRWTRLRKRLEEAGITPDWFD